MKESKAVYVTKRDIKVELNREYQFYANKIIRDREYSSVSTRYEQKTQEVGCQYDCKRDNLICTCRNLATLRKRQEVRYFKLPKQIYAYHGSRSFTEIGVGSVKALQRKKVKKIYLPSTDDRGVGSSDLSSYLLRRTRQHRGSSYYENKRTSSKCVGGILEYNTGCVMNEKLSPIVQTVSGSTSPRESTFNKNIEIGSNTIVKILANNTTQVENIKKEIENKPEVKVEELKPVFINQGEMKTKTVDKRKPTERKEKDSDKDFSSDSLVQHVHNLENPSDDKQSHMSVETEDPMENKLEREYRKIFAVKSKSRESKPASEKPILDFKSTSTLRRRFEALRRGLARKEESKRNTVIVAKVSSQISAQSRKDVSINSDPPSLEGRSYSNTKTYSPFPQAHNLDRSIYNPRHSHYRRSVSSKKARGSTHWSSRPDDDDSECQGVKGMFKLWGKKFNLEEDHYKRRPTRKPSYTSSRKTAEKEIEELKVVMKSELEEKKGGRKFFFFKKKNKDSKEKSYKTKKDVTAGRCEVRDGLMIKIGGGGNQYVPGEVVNEPDIIPEVYDNMFRNAWLKKFLSHAIESRNSVQVRWNNKTYAPSSSTVFELMDNVYRETGIVLRSKSQVTIQSSYKSYTKQQHVNFVHQNIEAWMIPKTFTDRPKLLPVKMKCKSDEERKDNIEVRISDQKWYIDKSKAFSHKIEVVLHSKNFNKLNKEKSSEYLRIDIPKGFFVDSSSDDNNNKQPNNQSSDEEVYKIVEYETGSDLKKEKAIRNFDIGDHIQNNIKVTVSVKEGKDCNSKILETIIKKPPVHRDVVIQGSNVYIPKRCDVIGVGILTQRDLRVIPKPILKIQDNYSDDESEHNVLQPNQKKCEFAESYLQEYYRNWTPLGIDLYSWCVSDSHLRCCSENSRASFNNQGDGTKSCPNIYDDFQASTIVSSCGASSCSQCHTHDDAKKPAEKTKWFGKFKKKQKDAENKKDFNTRVLPKDSIEVCKKRKIYATSMKSKWAVLCPSFEQPYSVPSIESKGAQDTLTECPKLMKSCCKPIEQKPKKRACKKHVSLPDCDMMNSLLAKQLTDYMPESILAFKGTCCEACKKKGNCPKHATINPQPSCEIPRAPCRDSCEQMNKAQCAESRNSCEKPPSCPGTPPCRTPSCTPSQPSCPLTPPCMMKSSCPPSPPTPPSKKPPSCPSTPSCPPSPPACKKKSSPCPPSPSPLKKPTSCPSTPSSKKKPTCPPSPPPCKKNVPCPPSPSPPKKSPSLFKKKPSLPLCPPSPPPYKRPPPCPPSPPPCRKTPSCPPSPRPCKKPPSCPPSPHSCKNPYCPNSPPSTPPSPPPSKKPLSCPPSPPPCKNPHCPNSPPSISPSPQPCKKLPPCPSPPPSCKNPHCPRSLSSTPPSPPPCKKPPPCPPPPPTCKNPHCPNSPPSSSPSLPPCKKPPPCPPSPAPCKNPHCPHSLPSTPPSPQPCKKPPSCPPSPHSCKNPYCPNSPPSTPPTPPQCKKPLPCPPSPAPCKNPHCPHSLPSTPPSPRPCKKPPSCPPSPHSCKNPYCPNSPPSTPPTSPPCKKPLPCPPLPVPCKNPHCPHSPPSSSLSPPPCKKPPPCPSSPAPCKNPHCPHSAPSTPPCKKSSPSPPPPTPCKNPHRPNSPLSSSPSLPPCKKLPPCPQSPPPCKKPQCPHSPPSSLPSLPPCKKPPPSSPLPPPCNNPHCLNSPPSFSPSPSPCKKPPLCPPPPPPPCKNPCCPHSPPSCPHITSRKPSPPSCPHSPPCPPSPPPCPNSPPLCPHSPLPCPHSTPPCPHSPPPYSHSTPPFRPKPNLSCPHSPPCTTSPPPCNRAAPPTFSASPPSCCSVDPDCCPPLPPPCKKALSNNSKKLSPFFKKKLPICPGSPSCKPTSCKPSYCKALGCQPSPCEMLPPSKKPPCGPSPCQKFSMTSISYGSLNRTPDAPFIYSPIHPCPPEYEKPKPKALPCSSSPCYTRHPEYKVPPFHQQTAFPESQCDQCQNSDHDFPWPTKNQVSNQSSITSLCQAKAQRTEPTQHGQCKRDCPMVPKLSCETIPSPKKECKKTCPNRQGSPRPPCMPKMQCPPPRPPSPPAEPIRSPTTSERIKYRNKSKSSGLYLKMKPVKRSTCSKDCLAWDSGQADDGCISLNSEEKITIRLKKETPSTEEIREGMNIKVQDEDGMTLFERKDYRLQHADCSMQRNSLLGDMYRASEVRRVATNNSVHAIGVDKEMVDGRSDGSVANLIEIQFKLKVTQGEKTTEINIANDGDKENEEDDNIEKKERLSKTTQEVFIVNDGGERSVDHPDQKNDINIRIVIKNFKPKSGKKKSMNVKHDEYSKDFAKKISAKFHTVSTGYSDVLHDDNVFSVHRATVDLTSSVDKSKTHSNKSEEIMSEPLTEHGRGILMDPSYSSVCSCNRTKMSKSGDAEVKSITSPKYSVNKEENPEETDTEKLTDHKYEYTEDTDTDKQIDHKYDTDETDTDKHVNLKYDTEETDTDKRANQIYDTLMSTDTDDPEAMEEHDTFKEKSMSIEVIVKPHTKDEKKEMLKQVMEKAHETKTKNKNRMRKLRDMLKVILTSDSSDHDDTKLRSNDLAKDITYASLKPNYFRDSDSMNNYYRTESHAVLSEGEINRQVVYPTGENNSEYTNSYVSSENGSPNRGCMCSTVAARLKLAARIGEGGGCCCGTKPNMKKNEETICDLKRESDFCQYDSKTPEFVDVETQNSRYLTSKNNSTNLSVYRSIRSDITGCIDMQKDIKADSGVINVDDRYPLRKTFSPHMNHVRECEMRKLSRSTNLSISDEDKIVLLGGRHTRISSESTNVKDKKKKDPIMFLHASDILQSYETKKAVLEIYTEKTISDEGERLVAKLPKFVYDRENEIQTNYEAMATNTYKAVCKKNIVMMAINR